LRLTPPVPSLCLLCSSRGHLRLRLHGGTAIRWCDACSLGFTEPRPGIDYGRFSYGDRDEALWASFAMPTVSLASGLATRKTWLDFGAGSGALVRAATGAGFDAVGVEIEASARESSIQLGTRVCGSIDEVPATRVGVISVSHVLEHLEDPVALLRLRASHLGDDGILGCCTARLHRPGPPCRTASMAAGWEISVTGTFTAGSLSTVVALAGLSPARPCRTSLHYHGSNWKCKLIKGAAWVSTVFGMGDSLSLVCRKRSATLSSPSGSQE
jgi:hypothetical protein